MSDLDSVLPASFVRRLGKKLDLPGGKLRPKQAPPPSVSPTLPEPAKRAAAIAPVSLGFYGEVSDRFSLGGPIWGIVIPTEFRVSPLGILVSSDGLAWLPLCGVDGERIVIQTEGKTKGGRKGRVVVLPPDLLAFQGGYVKFESEVSQQTELGVLLLRSAES